MLFSVTSFLKPRVSVCTTSQFPDNHSHVPYLSLGPHCYLPPLPPYPQLQWEPSSHPIEDILLRKVPTSDSSSVVTWEVRVSNLIFGYLFFVCLSPHILSPRTSSKSTFVWCGPFGCVGGRYYGVLTGRLLRVQGVCSARGNKRSSRLFWDTQYGTGGV